MNENVIAGVVGFIVLFIVARFILLWYWKIDRRIELQEDILRATEKTNWLLDELVDELVEAREL